MARSVSSPMNAGRPPTKTTGLSMSRSGSSMMPCDVGEGARCGVVAAGVVGDWAGC